MNKRDIITKCIEAYTEAVEVCDKIELGEAMDWLDQRCLIDGVCLFYNIQYGKSLLFCEWVERNETTHEGYWTTPAHKCKTHPELMQSLTTRLEILQRELLIND